MAKCSMHSKWNWVNEWEERSWGWSSTEMALLSQERFCYRPGGKRNWWKALLHVHLTTILPSHLYSQCQSVCCIRCTSGLTIKSHLHSYFKLLWRQREQGENDKRSMQSFYYSGLFFSKHNLSHLEHLSTVKALSQFKESVRLERILEWCN